MKRCQSQAAWQRFSFLLLLQTPIGYCLNCGRRHFTIYYGRREQWMLHLVNTNLVP
jgi:hypothetical protein